MWGADGTASVRPKKDETWVDTPPRLTAASWGFWDTPVTPGVETSLSLCDVDNLSNIYLAWGWNLCSWQLESGETLRTYRAP
jgi:hypothetical protein